MAEKKLMTVRLVARDEAVLEASRSFIEHIFNLLEGRPFFPRPDGLNDHKFYLLWFSSMFKKRLSRGDAIAIRSLTGENILDSRIGARLADRRDRRAGDNAQLDGEAE